MQKREWIFNGHQKRHLIEVFHDFGTEQIFIKLNKILLNQGTLGVYDTNKKFSFFVDGELCEIEVKRQDAQIHYEFIHHAHSTSQVGQQQKWKDFLTNYGLGGSLIAIMLLMLSIATYFVIDFGHRKSIERGGIISHAKISHFSFLGGIANTNKVDASYAFFVGKEHYKGAITVLKNEKGDFVSPTGLLLSVGDQFEVLFASQNPQKNHLLLHRPTEKSLAKYQLKVRQNCLEGKKDMDALDTAIYCDCLRYHAYQLQGIEGLNQLYFQHHTPEEYGKFNEQTYQDFLQLEAVQKIIDYCKTLNE